MRTISRRQFTKLTAVAGLSALGLTSCSGEKTATSSAAPNAPGPSQANNANAEEPIMEKLSATIAGKTFSGTISDTPAARSFAAMLPLTVNMADLHRNEKYVYLDSTLPAGTDKPDRMEAGQIMLYGTNCLVVFYEGFANTYGGYSAIATIDDPSGLAEAVGSGTAEVTFDIQS